MVNDKTADPVGHAVTEFTRARSLTADNPERMGFVVKPINLESRIIRVGGQ